MRYAFGDYQLDTEARTLQRGGQRVPVQAKAFDLLVYLIEHRERVASPDELLDALWPGVHVGPAALSGAVQKARRAVEDDGEHQRVLHTEHGHGFRFVADVSLVPMAEAAPLAPTGSRTRWAAAAGVAALLLAAALFWLVNRQAPEALPDHSLAVLPFVNLSQDAANEPFTKGIHDDILTQISKIGALKVIARTSMERLDPNLSIPEIGSKLGVGTVLDGGVQRAGDRVRINVQLIDCETEAHLWAETYDRELTAANIFAIQSEIATTVADALEATLSPEEQDRLATLPTENLAAYEAYLLGKQRFAKLNTAALAEAVDYFQQAIELDPDFALAYVGLADSYMFQLDFTRIGPEEMLAKAQAATDKALELDDRLGEAYATLGIIKAFVGFDSEGAEAAFQRALELNPNYVTTYDWYGWLLRRNFGRAEEALTLHRKALELNPLSTDVINEVGRDLDDLGRFDEGLAQYEKALEIDPGYTFSYWSIGNHHWLASGQLDEAVRWFRKYISLDPDNLWASTGLGRLFMDLGDPDRAEYWVHQSLERGPESFLSNLAMQLLHLYRRDEASALDHGRKALAAHPYRFPELGPIGLLGEQELRAGRDAEARALYEEFFPELLYERDPEVDLRNYRAAIDLALILSRTGEQERADWLLDRGLQQVQKRPRLGRRGYGIADVQIHALRGEKQKALAALRQAIDEGWRVEWWYQLRHKPDLESLHDDPEFRAMVAEIEADMVAQLARVREMERRGELTFPAEWPTPRDHASGSSPTDRR